MVTIFLTLGIILYIKDDIGPVSVCLWVGVYYDMFTKYFLWIGLKYETWQKKKIKSHLVVVVLQPTLGNNN